MSENDGRNALVLFEGLRSVQLRELNQKERDELGRQIMQVLPPRADIKIPPNAVIYAYYCISNDINPLKGPYAWEQRGKLVIQEPYTVFVRWARSAHEFNEWFTDEDPAEHGLEPGDIISKAWVLREDKEGFLGRMTKIFGEERALVMACSTGVGVITEEERHNTVKWVNRSPVPLPREEWTPIDPPKGWTWRQKAEKRALTAALRRSHGEPSPEEMRMVEREVSWETVEGLSATPEDWAWASPDQPLKVQELEAASEVEARAVREEMAAKTPVEREEQKKKNVAILRGEDEDPLELELERRAHEKSLEPEFEPAPEEEMEPDPEPEPEPEPDKATAPDLVDELRKALEEYEDGSVKITNGRHCYLINKVREEYGYDPIDWRSRTTPEEMLAMIGEIVSNL